MSKDWLIKEVSFDEINEMKKAQKKKVMIKRWSSFYRIDCHQKEKAKRLQSTGSVLKSMMQKRKKLKGTNFN